MWQGTKTNRFSAFPRATSGSFEDEHASEHRIKIYKELARLAEPPPSYESELELRRQRQMELAASRHPRWRDGDGH
jgi:hypothetical protein